VCPHVEWAIARVLSAPVRLEWAPQPVEPAAHRAECTWSGRAGTGGELAAALRQWPMIRFEVTEEPSPGLDGERFMHVPGRGLFQASTSANGDIQLSEDRVRTLLATASGHDSLTHAIERALGTSWDAELEPYRHAGEGSPMILLNRVG
jgi:hypothetical protein